jgi:predicted nucleotidyltransferase
MAARIELSHERIAKFCQRWKITEFGLFGSVLRDDFRSDSDIDVLVTFSPEARWSLFDLVKMENELSQIFDREVDLVERIAVEHSPNYIRRKNILQNTQVVYAA